MNDKSTEVEKIEEKEAPNKKSRITVLIVDSCPPFPELALYTLDAIPRRGDLINIAISGKLVGHKVDFVSFNPFNERNQVTLGCSFSAPTIAANGEPIDLKERMDQAVKAQMQVFEKAQAYHNALVCWNFRCVDVFQRRADTKAGVLSREHVHMFVEIPPHIAVSDFVRRVKGRSRRATKPEGFSTTRLHSFPMAGPRWRIPPSHVRKTSHAFLVATNTWWASTAFTPSLSNVS